ncbi:hypothetical protein SprV_0100502500 [Sparganum proliferum]
MNVDLSATSSLGYNTIPRRGLIYPCAWLESGGFFDPFNLYVSKGPFVQSRSKCRAGLVCPKKWLPNDALNSLTFKLIGTDDMRDYTFQAHFCRPIYTHRHSYCRKTEEEIAFELRQIGTWLTLSSVFCRCNGNAEVDSISYSRGVRPTDKVFPGNHYQMTCAPKRECSLEESCYVETPNSDGLLYGGKVLCHCPPKHFCPIYYIRGKRVAQYGSKQQIVQYGLKCKKRAF